MNSLTTPRNREPIKATAARINRTVHHTRELCKAGKLDHIVDATGHYWSSKAAADAFNGAERRQPIPADIMQAKLARVRGLLYA